LQACHAATAAVHLFYTGKIFGNAWLSVLPILDVYVYPDPGYSIPDPTTTKGGGGKIMSYFFL
jgi:hypothetical protein